MNAQTGSVISILPMMLWRGIPLYLILSSPQLLQHGVLIAIHYQRLLVQTAISVLEKKMVKSLKHFQLTILKGTGGNAINGDSGESKIFASSVPMLYRLTSFLMEAYQVFCMFHFRSTKNADRHLCV